MKGDDGYSMMEKFEAANIEIPDAPEIDPAFEHIVGWFYQLDAKRGAGLSGPAPLSYSEIKAWKELTGKITRPDEIDAIMAMDTAQNEAIKVAKEESK